MGPNAGNPSSSTAIKWPTPEPENAVAATRQSTLQSDVATTLPVQSGTHFATEAIVGHIEESIGRFTDRIPAAVRTLHIEHTGSMNPKHLAPPVVALALAAIIFNAKRNDVSGMRNGNDELRERIATARLADSSQEAAQPARPGATREPIDWNQLATMFRGGGDDNSIGVLSSKRQLLTLDTAGLLAELDRLAGIDLDDKTRKKLEMMIFESLAIKDPEAALDLVKELRVPITGLFETITGELRDSAHRTELMTLLRAGLPSDMVLMMALNFMAGDIGKEGFDETIRWINDNELTEKEIPWQFADQASLLERDATMKAHPVD